VIANALRIDIERYAVDVRSKNPLFTKAADGTLTPSQVASYLENLRYLIAHTPPHLAAARDRARALGHDELAAHYHRRVQEEIGHEVWATEDLAVLAPMLPATRSGRILASMQELVAYLGRRATEEPRLHLAYMLFAEYLTVIIGPDWLAALEAKCGVERRAMTVIAKHVDLDHEHVEHALDEIDDLVPDPRMLGPMREMLRESIARFEGFCAEVTLNECRSLAEGPADQASAA
jgi:pyrroloquinoline quinone (PQQ) biosynthesis protein C